MNEIIRFFLFILSQEYKAQNNLSQNVLIKFGDGNKKINFLKK